MLVDPRLLCSFKKKNAKPIPSTEDNKAIYLCGYLTNKLKPSLKSL
jgi:hypothetical protein